MRNMFNNLKKVLDWGKRKEDSPLDMLGMLPAGANVAAHKKNSNRKRNNGFCRADGRWVSPYMASLLYGVGIRLHNPKLVGIKGKKADHGRKARIAKRNLEELEAVWKG